MFAWVVDDEHCNSWSAVVQQVRSVVGLFIGVVFVQLDEVET